MISKTQFIRYALAAAFTALSVGQAIGSDNYIRLYNFTPPLAVHQSGINYGEEYLSVLEWGDKVRYSIPRNFLLSASFGVFRRAAEEINAIYNDGYSCYESAIAFPPPPYIGLTATTITGGNWNCLVFIPQPGSPT